MSHPQFAIVGAGPIGSLLCAYLSRAGNPCTLVDLRKDLVDTIRSNGLKIQFENENLTQKVEMYSSLEPLYGRGIKYIFLCVKSIHLSSLIDSLKAFQNTSTNMSSTV